MRVSNFVTFAAFSALLLATAGAAVADVYKIDPVHSYVGFKIRHMMVTSVGGTFDKFEGTINFDPQDVTKSTVEVVIDASSINTRNEKRDGDLRSDKFFDVANHPQITFKSKRIEKTKDGYTAVGDLTMRGVTKEVALPFTLGGPIANPWGKQVIGIDVTDFTINRQDYGVSWNTALEAGGVLVGDDVTIQLQVEAAKQ